MSDIRLYECLQVELEIENMLVESEGEISEEDFQALIIAQTTAIEKIEGVCQYVRKLELFTDTCNSEIERLNKKKSSANKTIDSIKKYLSPYIEKHGKIQAGTFTISNRKSESVEIENIDIVPAEFKRITQKIDPDKKSIKEAIKSGQKVNGAKLNHKNNTQIK